MLEKGKKKKRKNPPSFVLPDTWEKKRGENKMTTPTFPTVEGGKKEEKKSRFLPSQKTARKKKWHIHSTLKEKIGSRRTVPCRAILGGGKDAVPFPRKELVPIPSLKWRKKERKRPACITKKKKGGGGSLLPSSDGKISLDKKRKKTKKRTRSFPPTPFLRARKREREKAMRPAMKASSNWL